MPVLFCLHAFSMNALSFCDGMAGWLDKADQEGFIVVMPDGHMNSFNVGPGCGAAFVAAYVDGIDDVAFVRRLHQEVTTHLNVDLSRVYATGFSNGAALSWRLACEASDIFAAVAPVAGGICLEACEPTHPVAMLDIHGTADFISPPANHEMSIEVLAAANDCSTATEPASVPTSDGVTTCLTWQGCAAASECSDLELTQCTVEGGSHCWYGDISSGDCGAPPPDSERFATNLAWAFLSRLSR
jgi:polyhydroxybutyrate depolymerase